MTADRSTDPKVAGASFAPLALSDRIEVLDVLRGLAICGILIGNMQWFSGVRNNASCGCRPLADRRSSHAFSGSLFYRRQVLFDLLVPIRFWFRIADRPSRRTRRHKGYFIQTPVVLASRHRPAARLLALGRRYSKHLRPDGICALAVSKKADPDRS